MDRELRDLHRGAMNEKRRLTPDPEPMPENEYRRGFCPRCYDYRPFRIETHDNPDVTGAFCMNDCGFVCDPCELPHDECEAEDRFPDEVGR